VFDAPGETPKDLITVFFQNQVLSLGFQPYC